MEESLNLISQGWFLTEPALFQIFCTHQLKANERMKCPMRSGRGLLEYNPEFLENYDDEQIEELLRAEAIRILLKHPYDRQPSGCQEKAKVLGSNCVLADNYIFMSLKLKSPKDFKLLPRQHYEYYAKEIQRLLPPDDPSNGKVSSDDYAFGNNGLDSLTEGCPDISATWQEDELMVAQVNQAIRDIKNWGSLPGNLVEQIVASTKARVDYRKILAGFRATVISQARRLTRMRPNRRSGFETMGSRYDFTTRLIIGIDASGSISSTDLQNFYGSINRFFKYGISQIDVVQFDTRLYEVETLDKAMPEIKVRGRGGTCFQPFIDYVAEHPEYDGVIIYTDGYAKRPSFPKNYHTPLCWILDNKENLQRHERWMSESGMVCVMEFD